MEKWVTWSTCIIKFLCPGKWNIQWTVAKDIYFLCCGKHRLAMACCCPTQEATQPSYSPSVGNRTNKPKTDQENHIVRDPSYNIARLTRDVMDLRQKFVRCSIDKIAGIDSPVFGHSSATAIRPPILGPQ